MTFTAHCGTMGTVKETYTITTERKETKMNKIENAAVRRKKMNKEERPAMPGIVAVTKYLVGIWHESKCPSILLPVDCCECKYSHLCSKLDELAKVVDQ